MNNELNTGSGGADAVSAKMGNIRTLVHCLAIAVLILTGTLFVFIYRQVVITRKNTAEMVRYLVQYEESNTGEIIERVRSTLDAYRRQNPEFTPIFVKYFGTNQPLPAPPGTESKVVPTGPGTPSNTAH